MIKLETFIKKHTGITRYDREIIDIKFSKSGVDQNWSLCFNKGKLITDEVFTSYQQPTYLRSVEKCNSLEDVLIFLYDYSYSPTFVKVEYSYDLLGHPMNYLSKLNEVVKFNLDVNKLKGSVYYGRYELIFDNGYVTFIGNLMKKVNDGTYKITGKFDLLKITKRFLGRLDSDINFLQSVKKLEVL